MNTSMNLLKIPVDRLKPAKYNPRKDLKPGDPAYEKIKRSLHTYGYVDPVIWNEVTGNIVGGHQRYKVLVAEGIKEIDCVVVHIEDPQDEKALNIALNKAVGEWEPKALADLLQDLQLSGYDMGATGFDAAEIDDLFSSVHDKDVKDDDCELEPEEVAPFVKPGDVWTLGRHRMVCGDSTNPDDVDLLMDGVKANLVVTDPPYNVAYESADGKSIQNDSMGDEKFYEFLLAAFKNMATHMAEGGSAYIFHADTEGLNFRRAFKEAGFHISGVCIWEKNSLVLGRSPYQWQGKSELGAAIALNMLVNDDEWKAEVYSCASDRQQAAIVFDVAVDMVKQSPALMKRIKIIPSTKRMVYQPTGSIYQVLSSEVATKHGLNVSACIFDELHTQPTRALYDVMTQGSGDARKQPLWFLLTTAGTDRNSICWEVHQKALDILEGRKIDPRFYPVLFGLPDDADWTSEANWYKANPSLGYTITIDKVRDAFRKAQETPADENQFRQLRLNQWVKQSVRWMPMDKWDECGGAVDPYRLEGRVCYGGLDLSSTSDLTAFVLVFPPLMDDDEPYYVLPFFWLPEETLSLRVRRDHVPYDVWHILCRPHHPAMAGEN